MSGFSVIDKLDEVENIDLVCCFNVLDRCADPHKILQVMYYLKVDTMSKLLQVNFTILQDIHHALSPDGRAVIALVLPYSHYVETSQ